MMSSVGSSAGNWWLRSANTYNSYDVGNVYDYGNVNNNNANNTNNAVAPVVWLFD